MSRGSEVTAGSSRSRPTHPIRAIALLTVAPLVLSRAGCLTRRAIARWRAAPLESAKLEVIEARSDLVRLRWEATYRGAPARFGELTLNPHLPDCHDVRVVIRDGAALLAPAREGQDEPAPEKIPSPSSASWSDCDVFIVVARTSQDMALRASTAMHRLGATEIEAPHDHVWLAVIPVAIVGDTSITMVSLIPFLAYDYLSALGRSDEPTTWEWTP